MEKKVDISTREDITILVQHFYTAIFQDKLLGPIFREQIGDQVSAHLTKMVDFWHTLLLADQRYFGSPFLAHANLPIAAEHFERWLSLFYQSLDTLYEGPKAEDAKIRAFKMSEMFQHKLAYYAKNNNKPLL